MTGFLLPWHLRGPWSSIFHLLLRGTVVRGHGVAGVRREDVHVRSK